MNVPPHFDQIIHVCVCVYVYMCVDMKKGMDDYNSLAHSIELLANQPTTNHYSSHLSIKKNARSSKQNGCTYRSDLPWYKQYLIAISYHIIIFAIDVLCNQASCYISSLLPFFSLLPLPLSIFIFYSFIKVKLNPLFLTYIF